MDRNGDPAAGVDQVGRCAADLILATGAEFTPAQDAAMRAYAALTAAGATAHFDLDASTPYLLRVLDQETGRVFCLTLRDVLRMIGPRLAAVASPQSVGT